MEMLQQTSGAHMLPLILMRCRLQEDAGYAEHNVRYLHALAGELALGEARIQPLKCRLQTELYV